jgi:hypothetical protein
LLYYLNANPSEENPDLMRWLKKWAIREAGRRAFDFPDEAALRAQQQALRRVVDRYLKTRDLRWAANRVSRELQKRRYQAFLDWPEEQPFRPLQKGGRPALHFIRYDRPIELGYDDWLGFARLLESSLADRLKKCPECGTYFLALKRKDQEYHERACALRAADRARRRRWPKAYRAEKREAMRRSRQRKKEQTI